MADPADTWATVGDLDAEEVLDGSAAESAEPFGIMPGEIIEDAQFYFTTKRVRKKELIQRLSSFVLDAKMRVETEDGELFVADAHTDAGTTVPGLTLPRRAFDSRASLLKHLPSQDLQWVGNDNQVQ